MRTILNPPEDNPSIVGKPYLTFPLAVDKAACSLATTERFLIVGSVGKVFGYDWRAILAGKTPKVSWVWDLPDVKEELEPVEANALATTDSGNVYVGCGDKKIHMYSLEDGRLIKSLSGHDGYIHDLSEM